MLKTITMLTAVFSLVAIGAFAMDHGAMDHGKQGTMYEHEGHGEHTVVADAGDTATGAVQGDMGNTQLLRMQRHMETMDFIADELDDETEPAARLELMKKHMTEMRAAMKSMKGMMWCCMPGGSMQGMAGKKTPGEHDRGGGMMHEGMMHEGMKHGKMQGMMHDETPKVDHDAGGGGSEKTSGAAPADEIVMFDTLSRRMDMLQNMLEQMIVQQAAMLNTMRRGARK